MYGVTGTDKKKRHLATMAFLYETTQSDRSPGGRKTKKHHSAKYYNLVGRLNFRSPAIIKVLYWLKTRLHFLSDNSITVMSACISSLAPHCHCLLCFGAH